MPRLQLDCPSCGAKVPFESAASLLAVCAYCRGVALRKDLNLEELGRVAQLVADGSPLQLGARGRYDKAIFTVLGRLQMRFADGYWNEWHLGFDDGRFGWLGESQGLYAVSFPVFSAGALPPFEALAVGQALPLAGVAYTVREKRRALYASAEGEIPFRAPFGEEVSFADLAGPRDRSFATLDYSEEPPMAFAGRYAEFEALELTGLRAIDGW